MKKAFLFKKAPLLLLISGFVLTVTFAQTTPEKNKSANRDTTPKKEKQIKDLDEALLELDKGEIELSKALKEIDSEKMEREIRAAMKNMDADMARMKADLAKALKDVDMQRIHLDVQKSLAESQKELASVDKEKLKLQIEQSLANVDLNKMTVELKKLEEIDLADMKKQLAAIGPEIERSMEAAKKDIQKAKQEINDFKNLVIALDKDGWLNKNEDYKIEYKNKELTVNGKKLSIDVIKKYREFLSDKEDFTIRKEDDHFNVNK